MPYSQCPFCGSTEHKLIGRPFINGIAQQIIKEDYSVVECGSCSVYFVSPKIDFTPDECKQLYNNAYFSVQTPWLINKREKELDKRIDKLSAIIKKSKPRFLDVGCGEGNAMLAASKRGWEASGVDITDNREEKAKIEGIKFTEGNLLSLSLPGSHYDIVYVDSVLEHVTEPLLYLVEIRRILKDDGIVYIGVPNEDSLQNDIKKIMYSLLGKKGIASKLKPFDSPYHIIGFNKRSLKASIERAGYELVFLRNFGRKFEFRGFKFATKGFLIGLFLLPFEFLGALTGRDVYFEAVLKKKK